jgi:hypothetical protein
MESRRKYLKLSHEGKIKRATLFCDYENFKAEASSLFNIDFNDEEYEHLYIDEDNDIIQIESQADYDQALLYLYNNEQKTLKIRIVPKYSNEYSREMPQLLVDSLYNRRLNELNEEIDKFEHNSSYKSNSSMDSYNFLTCLRCNRTFNTDSYYKHIKVCWKVFQTKRIPFNSRRKRLTRVQMLYSIIHKDDEKDDSCNKNNWKEQSEEFRQFIRDLREQNCQKSQQCNQLKKYRRRNPFDSRSQRLKHLGEPKLNDYERREKRWKQLSQKFRALLKFSRMLRA